MDSRKENDLQKWFHCQRRGHITKNCLSKQCSDSPKAVNTAVVVSTGTSSTLTTSIETYWMVASSTSLSRDCFIDCRCTTHISGHQSMLLSYTKYSLYTNIEKGFNG